MYNERHSARRAERDSAAVRVLTAGSRECRIKTLGIEALWLRPPE